MSSKPSSALIPALTLVANMAGLYPPLSALPLAVSILTSIASAVKSPSSLQAITSSNPGLCMVCLSHPRLIFGLADLAVMLVLREQTSVYRQWKGA